MARLCIKQKYYVKEIPYRERYFRMSCVYLLFNPLSGGKKSESDYSETIKTFFGDKELIFKNVTEISDYRTLIDSMGDDDAICVCGGDGTLNHFINDIDGMLGDVEVYYYPTGSGNDFYHEVGKDSNGAPILINKYIADLPTVTVKGKTYRFLNGVGYGLDGYCCELGDKLRSETGKPVNYTALAIKGVLFHYKPTKAVVTVDGKEYNYKKVWIAPTMNGKYYGGGMMPTPSQDRLSSDKSVSVLSFHDAGKIQTLMALSAIFTGEHVKKKKIVTIYKGHNITVRFDRPVTIQIDGETISDVSEYTVSTDAVRAENQIEAMQA